MTYSPKPGDVMAVQMTLGTDGSAFVDLGHGDYERVLNPDVAPWTPPELLEAYEELYEFAFYMADASDLQLREGLVRDNLLKALAKVREIKEKIGEVRDGS